MRIGWHASEEVGSLVVGGLAVVVGRRGDCLIRPVGAIVSEAELRVEAGANSR